MLFKKMLRDISKHKAQFLSIFLMAFLGVFVFAGVGGESVGLEVNVNDYYEETNLADGWIYSNYINDLFLYQVDCLGATDQMERQLVVDSVADFKNDPEITLHFVENNTISKFYLMEGEELNVSDVGEVNVHTCSFPLVLSNSFIGLNLQITLTLCSIRVKLVQLILVGIVKTERT